MGVCVGGLKDEMCLWHHRGFHLLGSNQSCLSTVAEAGLKLKGQ